MASGTNTSTSKIATIVVLIPMLIAAWFAAPLFLPVWRWQNLDIEDLARKYGDKGYTKERLEKEFDMIVWYNPRGGRGSKDPCPFQIVSMTPTWLSQYPDGVDENQLLVRISLVDERNGEPISKMWIGTNPSEAFFKIKGMRLPPGVYGKPKGRPVVVFKGLSFDKVELTQGISLENQVKFWENDDMWDERDDGFRP